MTSGDLIETFRAEAIALLAANQAARVAAQRLGILIVLVMGIGIGAALTNDEPRVLVAVPTVVLVLSAIMFQQFADVSVMGAARAALEERLVALGAGGLIYERAVAGIRKRSPLATSVRALQGLLASLVIAFVIVAAVIAFSGGYGWTLPVAYVITTLPAFAVAGASYRDMLESGAVAHATVRRLLETE